jgi:hypothetical protein
LAELQAVPQPDISSPDAMEVSIDQLDASTFEDEQDIPFFEDTFSPRRVRDPGCSLHERWMSLLPTLVDPFLAYITSSRGSPVNPVSDLNSKCLGTCEKKTTNILCLYLDRMLSLTFTLWLCHLILHGRLQDDQGIQLSLPEHIMPPGQAWPFPNSSLTTSHGSIDRSPRLLLGIV